MAELVIPGVRWRGSFLAAWDELAAETDDVASLIGAWRYLGDHFTRDEIVSPDGFVALIEELRAQANPAHPRAAHLVPATMLWWVDGDEWIGRVSIRHVLNQPLRERGGHIGYLVRPSRRRERQATAPARGHPAGSGRVGHRSGADHL